MERSPHLPPGHGIALSEAGCPAKADAQTGTTVGLPKRLAHSSYGLIKKLLCAIELGCLQREPLEACRFSHKCHEGFRACFVSILQVRISDVIGFGPGPCLSLRKTSILEVGCSAATCPIQEVSQTGCHLLRQVASALMGSTLQVVITLHGMPAFYNNLQICTRAFQMQRCMLSYRRYTYLPRNLGQQVLSRCQRAGLPPSSAKTLESF